MIMVDEYVNVSNKEQVVSCFRYICQSRFQSSGLYSCPDITANTIVHVIKDTY